MGDVFQRLITTPGRSSGWLLRDEGGALHQTLGFGHDAYLADDARRILASLPSHATIASLREIAKDRHVLTFPEQSRASQEDQCLNWIDANKDAGLPIGVLRQAQSLWYPARPTVRVVGGNSARAKWDTLYGDDDVQGIDEARGISALTPYTPTTPYWSVRQDPTNWDWDSTWDLGAPEPAKIHRVFLIVYAPPGTEEYTTDPDVSETNSLGSPNVTQRFGLNMAAMARFWKAAGSLLWGWILAFDHESFDPMNDVAHVSGGYPDGDWFRAYIPGEGFNRLQTARYYEIQDPIP